MAAAARAFSIRRAGAHQGGPERVALAGEAFEQSFAQSPCRVLMPLAELERQNDQEIPHTSA